MVLLVTALAGCTSNNRLKKEDPLFGEFPKPNGPAPNGPSKTKAGLPAYPEATTTSSTAAMAAGVPLAGSRPLGIGDGGWYGMSGKAEGATGTLTNNPGSNGNPIPALRQPEPVIGDANGGSRLVTKPGGLTVVPTDPWGQTSKTGDYRQLQAELQARKVTWQRLETHNDGFKFTCAVPNPANPDFQRVYEATARDAESAIHAVLMQFDRPR